MRVFRAREIHSNSTGGSTGLVIISDMNQYGTVYIWDQNTYNMNITDILASTVSTSSSLNAVVNQDNSTTQELSDNNENMLIYDK